MTITEIEVDYLLWEADDPYDRPCAKPDGCPNVAVYRVKFGPAQQVSEDCQCRCGTVTQMCLACYDHMSQPGVVACVGCLKFKVIRSSEPLR